MTTLLLMIVGLMLLLATPSCAIICYECTYVSDMDSNPPGCGQHLDPTNVPTCSGSVCYSYMYNSSDQGGLSLIIRGCADLGLNASNEQCLLNSEIFNTTFYLFENQCCYNGTASNAAITSCYCKGDYCNYNIWQSPVAKEAIGTTSLKPENTFPWNSNTSVNSTGFINCYSCWYSSYANNARTNLSCEDPSIAYDGGSCDGEACATFALASEGYFGIHGTCVTAQHYKDNLRRCQDNATYFGIKFFFYENQCCYSDTTDDTDSSTGCFCADSYCNTRYLQPTIVPRTQPPSSTNSSGMGTTVNSLELTATQPTVALNSQVMTTGRSSNSTIQGQMNTATLTNSTRTSQATSGNRAAETTTREKTNQNPANQTSAPQPTNQNPVIEFNTPEQTTTNPTTSTTFLTPLTTATMKANQNAKAANSFALYVRPNVFLMLLSVINILVLVKFV